VTPRSFETSGRSPYKVKDQRNDRHDEQQMNQPTGNDMKYHELNKPERE
jgi:hypothetical protein